MSEQLPNLYLEHGQFILKTYSAREHHASVRDIQMIHDPTRSKFGMGLQRLAAISVVDLSAKPHDNACALFEVSMAVYDQNEVRVMIDNTDHPSQAAGWAALQLYYERATGQPLGQLIAAEPQAPASDEFNFLQRYTKDSILEIVPAPQKGASIISVYAAEPLPLLLERVQTIYEYLYPDIDSSIAVANIVGANNLLDFQEAWVDIPTNVSPVTAARTLLESDVFKSTPFL